ncbi:MAG: hypothetical protein PHE78_08570 [Candidatus Gastranaerophilales bacterium]|nr:hypothetical protein [Candidatus Gastranaerophilales bacterium]
MKYGCVVIKTAHKKILYCTNKSIEEIRGECAKMNFHPDEIYHIPVASVKHLVKHEGGFDKYIFGGELSVAEPKMHT